MCSSLHLLEVMEDSGWENMGRVFFNQSTISSVNSVSSAVFKVFATNHRPADATASADEPNSDGVRGTPRALSDICFRIRRWVGVVGIGE